MKNEIVSIYPANSLQQGFIYHAISQAEDDAYHLQFLFDIFDKLDLEKYLLAWEATIAKYPALRTAFNWEEEPIQIIYKKGQLNYAFHDLSQVAEQNEKDKIIELTQVADRKKRFDLTKPSLIRLNIFKLKEDHYTILKSESHCIIDGWSDPILLSSVNDFYQSLLRNEKLDIQEDTAYTRTQDYISEHKSECYEFWKKVLVEKRQANDISPLLDNHVDLLKYKTVESPESQTLHISGEKHKKLQEFCSNHGITINTFLQLIWHKVLQAYTNSDTTIVGTVVSGRNLPIDGIEQSIGLFINTLPLVVDWNNNNSVLTQLRLVQESIANLNTYGFVNLVDLQNKGQRLFHSLFIYENYPLPENLLDTGHFAGVVLKKIIEKVDYPITILVHTYSESLTIDLEFDKTVLATNRALEHLQTMDHLIGSVLENFDKSHTSFSIIHPTQYNLVIKQWNSTNEDSFIQKTIVSAFEEQVIKTPDNLATVFEDQILTFRELNNRSNQLAKHLREAYAEITKKELEPGTPIPICVDRSIELVIGILAILKAGAAYVPIDPTTPDVRKDYILKDVKTPLILTQRNLSNSLQFTASRVKSITIDQSESFYSTENFNNINLSLEATDLAYVIYTSGTTGQPKGVLIEHQSVVNEIKAQLKLVPLNSYDKSLLTANYVFDASVECIFMSMLSGGCLYIIKESLLFNEKMLKTYIQAEGITVLNTTPGYLMSLNLTDFPNSVKHVILGGEPYKKIALSANIYNSYGPTETTIVSTATKITDLQNSTIGKPLANTRVYVLDKHLQPIPIGVTGELFIAGVGVSRGYLNQPELTNQKFIDNKFATEDDFKRRYTRMFKTGDLARWLPDGNLEYCGRNDDQVKIRGHRIELQEIEITLSTVNGVKNCCVLAFKDSNDEGYLVGYIVKEDSIELKDVEKGLEFLLPGYMIPRIWIEIERLPLTVNGKVDKTTLPIPDHSLIAAETFTEPANTTETKLLRIWQEVLDRDHIGTKSSFFNVGGHSIKLIRMSQMINSEFKVVLPIDRYFALLTIEDIAREIDKITGTTLNDNRQSSNEISLINF